MNWFVRGWILLLVACAVAAGVAAVDSAHAAGQYRIEQAPVEDVLTALKVDEVSADYIVLVDTSITMRKDGRYGRAVAAVDMFVRTLSPTDFLSLNTFDTVAHPVWSGPVGSDPSGIVARLPKKPDGDWTDIGAAMQQSLDDLERPGAADVAAVILITDGKLDPDPGTRSSNPYFSKTSPGWKTLRDRAAAVGAKHTVNAYGLGLTSGTDIALLREVFPSAKLPDLPQSQLAALFDRAKQQARRDTATNLLESDTGSVELSWQMPEGALDLSTGRADANLVITSSYTRIPVVVLDLSAASTGEMDVQLSELSTGVPLAPGETKVLPVSLGWTVTDEFRAGKAQVTSGITLEATGTVVSPWEQTMAEDLNLAFAPALTASVGTASGEREIGTSWTLIAAAAAGLLALLGILWLLMKPPPKPRLSGSYLLNGVQGSLSAKSNDGAVLIFGGREGKQPRVEVPGAAGDELVVEAVRPHRRAPVEMRVASCGSGVEVRAHNDDMWRLPRKDAVIEPRTEFRIGDNIIRF